MSIPVITIDGPSGVGKGTAAYLLAKKMSWHLLDSGAIYRAFAIYVEKKQCNQSHIKIKDLVRLAKNMPLKFIPHKEKVKIMLANTNITNTIRTEKYGNLASILSTSPKVRKALLSVQRAYKQYPGLIADGRDMGTVVFPKAQVKFFLTATVNARTIRRLKQLKEQKLPANIHDVRKKIVERDRRDSNRKASPLKPAKDSIIIDTSKLSIKEVFSILYKHVLVNINLFHAK